MRHQRSSSQPPKEGKRQLAIEELATSEVDSGFLAQILTGDCDWPADMQGSASEDTDEHGEELEGLSYSNLVKRELELVIKLRRIAEGKPAEVSEGDKEKAVGEKEHQAQVSKETLEMQRLRKERNRRAAIDCRRNRRNRERKLNERVDQLKSEKDSLAERARRFEQLYRDSLRSMPTQGDFQNYLKRNPELVRDPLVKPVLRAFVSEDFPKLPQYVMMALVPASSVQG